jgi:ATP-binding protein involved in chromosome partitioning
MPRMQRGLPQKRSIRDVKKIIAVSSAKGGVGKSTIAGMSLPYQTPIAQNININIKTPHTNTVPSEQ